MIIDIRFKERVEADILTKQFFCEKNNDTCHPKKCCVPSLNDTPSSKPLIVFADHDNYCGQILSLLSSYFKNSRKNSIYKSNKFCNTCEVFVKKRYLFATCIVQCTLYDVDILCRLLGKFYIETFMHNENPPQMRICSLNDNRMLFDSLEKNCNVSIN